LHPSSLAKRGTVLLFIACIAFYFYGLGHFPLLGPDEPRYAQVAREMFTRHDFITPTLGGYLWFEKPALLYWMMIASFKLFGVTEWAARLPAAVSGILTIAAVLAVSRRAIAGISSQHSETFVFWSVFASATTLGIVVFSRAASFDIILTMTTSWALAFYVLHEFEENVKMRAAFLAGFYSFVGLSLLAKGLVGLVIPLGVVGLYHLLQRELPARDALISLLWGLPMALIVAGLWYVPVISRHGWLFIDQFFIQHHFARYLSNKYHHRSPFYYYLLIIPLLALPWTAFMVDGLRQSLSWLRRTGASLPDNANESLRRLLIFALAWVLFPVFFFSFSGSKLPGYILPVLPAAALIVGERLWRLSLPNNADVRRWPLATTALLCLVFAIATLGYSWRTGRLSFTTALMIAVPLLAAGCFPFFLPRKPTASVLFIAGGLACSLIVTLNFAAPAFAERESSKHLLQLADVQGYSQAPVYGLQRDDRTPEFYAAGRIVYGPDGEPTMYEGVGQVEWESRKRQATILSMVPVTQVADLTRLSSMRVNVIGDNGKFALVAVGPP
jgi:4-amino-4-deoxy-L-arabinose transferase-like glycosyltransferase